MFKPNLACGYLWSICWLSFKVLLLVPLGSIHFKINLKDGSHSILKHLSKQKLKFSYVFYNADIAQYIHNAFAFQKKHLRVFIVFNLHTYFIECIFQLGLPRQLNGSKSACQWRRCRRCGFSPRVGKIPRRRKWQPTPVFLPRKSHGQRSLWPTVHRAAELDMTELLSTVHS